MLCAPTSGGWPFSAPSSPCGRGSHGPSAGPAASSGVNVSLAEAFAALLTAEQGRAVAPSPFRPDALSDELVDEIVRRVIDRLGDQAVRGTVLEIAERLVREEIARIKSHAR